MKINSIKKGKRFELDIVKLLTKTTGVKWHRVPMSGAFSTNNKSEDSRFDGDVFTEDERYKDLVIECKAYADLQINDLFNKKSKFFGWINQSVSESKGKEWVLFIKINNKGTFIVYDIGTGIFGSLTADKDFLIVDKRFLVKLK